MRKAVVPCLVTLLALVGLLAGCSNEPSEEEVKSAELQQISASVQVDWDALKQARVDLAAAQAEKAEIEGVAERRRTDEQKERLAALETEIPELESGKDAGYESVQEQLATLLTLALNDFPQAPETVTALEIYAEESMVTAQDHVANSGNYKKAIDILTTARSYFESVNLKTYQPLEEKLIEYDQWRFMTRERFDMVKKGMTHDEVAAVAGVPYYLNKKEDAQRKITFWLYPKREGGAAAVYFNRKGIAYSMTWEAVKTKIVN